MSKLTPIKESSVKKQNEQLNEIPFYSNDSIMNYNREVELIIKCKQLKHLQSIDLSKFSYPNETLPPTDYTYAKTASYLTKPILNDCPMPNLRRRRIGDLIFNKSQTKRKFFKGKLNLVFIAIIITAAVAAPLFYDMNTTTDQSDKNLAEHLYRLWFSWIKFHLNSLFGLVSNAKQSLITGGCIVNLASQYLSLIPIRTYVSMCKADSAQVNNTEQIDPSSFTDNDLLQMINTACSDFEKLFSSIHHKDELQENFEDKIKKICFVSQNKRVKTKSSFADVKLENILAEKINQVNN